MTRWLQAALTLLLATIVAGRLAADEEDVPASASPPAPTPAPLPLRIEPLGLSTPFPPRPGLVPVILVHGLWVGPRTWEPMIQELSADPEIAATHQFWTFGYATGDPLPYSARLLRAAIDETRARLDPDRRDPALDRIVLIGHSMGGLVVRLLAVDSGDRFWRLVSDHPPERLVGEPDDVDLARGCLIFHPRPDVRAVIFLATPHGGGSINQGFLHDLAGRLVSPPDPLLKAYHRLINANPQDFFRPSFRSSLITSIDELRRDSPMLRELQRLQAPPSIAMHSIIPLRTPPPHPLAGDGVVPYASSHLDVADSEIVVPGGHFCQNSPAVLAAVRRLLLPPHGD